MHLSYPWIPPPWISCSPAKKKPTMLSCMQKAQLISMRASLRLRAVCWLNWLSQHQSFIILLLGNFPAAKLSLREWSQHVLTGVPFSSGQTSHFPLQMCHFVVMHKKWDSWFGAQQRHLFALRQAGILDTPEKQEPESQVVCSYLVPMVRRYYI